MRGILKNTLLLLGGMALGSLATRRAIRYAVENRYDRVKYEEPIFGTGEDAEQVLDGLKTLISTYGNATAADLYELAGIHDFKYEMTRIPKILRLRTIPPLTKRWRTFSMMFSAKSRKQIFLRRTYLCLSTLLSNS